ncbi:hypothetical protein SKUN_00719 [Spiroplasma kunkelii CR2-3x]|uniref:Spiroplasmavirus-related protein n=1 Tax=Spiroplasma kunkelii CR2-3x TaxID=273035 RepID=A0A0K2JG86_SPIKU|nr:hypothetical protein [Spiroplasma kunkelii]ALA97610.1 hypothetical protein SKUN_00719 [Spiroplasma kunkelii CR2-3x]
MYKVLLAQIDFNHQMDSKEKDGEKNDNKGLFFDIFTFMQLDEDDMPMPDEYIISWVWKESKLANELPEMKKGNYYLIDIKFPVVTDRKTGRKYNKVSVVKVVPYNKQQDFINKYSNNSAISESNS